MMTVVTDDRLERELVVDFAAIDADMVPIVGGKAANLGVMTRAKLPVPGGFCVTTEAYRRIADGRLDQILAALSETEAKDLARIAELAGAARGIIAAADVPDDIADSIRAGYRALGDQPPVAVRSSATAEDLATASFAGQQDTYLNVVGEDAVLDAVRRCWASLWTDRAVTYRTSNEVDHETVTLAVVVQQMVEVETAGVMFTANPVTGRRKEVVIDASPGLGEAVVSGAVNPDHFVVDQVTARITERRLGDKSMIIRALPGGGTEREQRADNSSEPCLSDDQLRALALLGGQVEDHYGAPQDTEWAIDRGGKLWLTQSRPITTLYPIPVKKGSAQKVYFCVSLAQGLTRPITPMGRQEFRLITSGIAQAAGFEIADPVVGATIFADPGQRIFVDATAAIRSKPGRALMLAATRVMEARTATVLQQLFDNPHFRIRSTSWRPIIRRIAPIALKGRMPARVLQAVVRPRAAIRWAREGAAREIGRSLEVPAGATPEERLDHAERMLTRVILPMAPMVLPIPAVGFALLGLSRRLLGDLAKPGELQTVLRGLPNNTTTEMDLELWRIAQAIRADTTSAEVFTSESLIVLVQAFRDGVLPRVAQSGFESFLRTYGDRAVGEIDVGMPRWRDDPTHIISVVANYARLTDDSIAPDVQFSKGAAEAESMIISLVRRAQQLGPIKVRLVELGLRRARQLAGLREQPKFFMITTIAAARAQMGIVGAELAAAGRIEKADDIFMLDLTEARAALAGRDQHQLVAERRAGYEQELRRRHVPRLLLSDGTEPETKIVVDHDLPAGTLVGSPASAGIVTGIARVVLDPVGARLEPGEILVAPSTDPGWTPLFLTAGGLVMEMGGSNSHGAVVARECGIPAVVGVPDATHKITDGQRITVDGATGTVTPA